MKGFRITLDVTDEELKFLLRLLQCEMGHEPGKDLHLIYKTESMECIGMVEEK